MGPANYDIFTSIIITERIILLVVILFRMINIIINRAMDITIIIIRILLPGVLFEYYQVLEYKYLVLVLGTRYDRTQYSNTPYQCDGSH